jgi:hypothetical protein
MTIAKILAGTFLCTALSLCAFEQSVALPMMNSGMRATGDDMIVNVRARWRETGGARSVSRTDVNRTNVSRTNVNVNQRANVNVNRNVQVCDRSARGVRGLTTERLSVASRWDL